MTGTPAARALARGWVRLDDGTWSSSRPGHGRLLQVWRILAGGWRCGGDDSRHDTEEAALVRALALETP